MRRQIDGAATLVVVLALALDLGCSSGQPDPSSPDDSADDSADVGDADWSDSASCPSTACDGARQAVELAGEACFCDDGCVDRGDCCANILEICTVADIEHAACDQVGAEIRDSALFSLYLAQPAAFEAACNANPRGPNLFPGLDEATIAARIDAYCTFDLAVRACLVCGVKSGRTLADAYDATCAPMFTPDDRARFEQTVLGR